MFSVGIARSLVAFEDASYAIVNVFAETLVRFAVRIPQKTMRIAQRGRPCCVAYFNKPFKYAGWNSFEIVDP
jgi:hypothetical protein